MYHFPSVLSIKVCVGSCLLHLVIFYVLYILLTWIASCHVSCVHHSWCIIVSFSKALGVSFSYLSVLVVCPVQWRIQCWPSDQFHVYKNIIIDLQIT